MSGPAPLNSVLEAIGRTPLIRLNRVARGVRTPVLAKAEQFNPGGSVKDRIGLAIIEAAERSGALKPGGVIVEGTSGNTGVGLAIAAAIKGYRCIFTIPDKMSTEKIRLLRAFGAEVVVVPTAVPPDHPEYYIQKAKAIVAATPGRRPGGPALQSRQPGGALPHHRARDLGTDRRPRDALRVLAGDRRHGVRAWGDT